MPGGTVGLLEKEQVLHLAQVLHRLIRQQGGGGHHKVVIHHPPIGKIMLDHSGNLVFGLGILVLHPQ